MNDRQFRTFAEIMERLKDIERTLARFYALCALRFPEDKELWEDLSRNEEDHARRAGEFEQLVSTNKENYEPDKFNSAPLHTYRSGLEDEIRRLENGEIGRPQALMIARDYEQTLVEKQYYRVVRSSRPEYRQIAEDIASETQAHFQRLTEYIQRHFRPTD